MFSLTSKEHEIMELMWLQAKALSRADIIELSESSRTWKASSVHVILNSMLDKGAIEVEGFVKTGKNYGRTFRPTVTQEEYTILRMKSSIKSIPGIVSALVNDDDVSDETIEAIEEILRQKKSDREISPEKT